MRKAIIIYNPHSGRRRHLRTRHAEAAANVFRSSGIETLVVATTAAGSAGEQARDAVLRGFDAVIACGGDGTVHDVLQGTVGTAAALGVIPLGTGNALAQDLALPRDPVAAARALVTSRPLAVPVGRVEYLDKNGSDSRYFLTVVGVGADAEMLYRLAFQFKTRFGMLSYYAVAAQLWLTHEFVPFTAEFNDIERGIRRCEQVTQVLAVHISTFGGLLRQLAPGAALGANEYRLVLFRTASRMRYLHYVLGVMSRQHWPVEGVEIVRCTDLVCTPMQDRRRIYVEADGELLGRLPARLRMTQETVSVLLPQSGLLPVRTKAEALPAMNR